MINKKNKPASLIISQFVENSRQNIRPVSSITPEPATDETEEKKEEDATSLPTELIDSHMETEVADDPVDGVTVEKLFVSDEKIEEQSASEETPKRKRAVQQKAIKRDKLMAIRFDKKMHKDISLIKLNYEIDIQDRNRHTGFRLCSSREVHGRVFPERKSYKGRSGDSTTILEKNIRKKLRKRIIP